MPNEVWHEKFVYRLRLIDNLLYNLAQSLRIYGDGLVDYMELYYSKNSTWKVEFELRTLNRKKKSR